MGSGPAGATLGPGVDLVPEGRKEFTKAGFWFVMSTTFVLRGEGRLVGLSVLAGRADGFSLVSVGALGFEPEGFFLGCT